MISDLKADMSVDVACHYMVSVKTGPQNYAIDHKVRNTFKHFRTRYTVDAEYRFSLLCTELDVSILCKEIGKIFTKILFQKTI